MSLAQAIDDYINKYKSNPYSTQGGSAAVNAEDQQATADLLDALNSRKTNYTSQMNALNDQKTQAAAEGQDQLNQDAVDEQTDLRRVMETMANYGNTAGGQMPQLMLQANANRENKDNSIYNQRKTDTNTILGKINDLETSGLADLDSLIGQSNAQRSAKIADIQAQEAAAQQAAQLAAQRSSSSGGGGGSASQGLTLDEVKKMISGKGPDAGLDILQSYNMPQYASMISDKELLWNADGQPYAVNNLADYADAVNSGYNLRSGGYMYDKYGNSHFINSLAGYNAAVAQKWTPTKPYGPYQLQPK